MSNVSQNRNLQKGGCSAEIARLFIGEDGRI